MDPLDSEQPTIEGRASKPTRLQIALWAGIVVLGAAVMLHGYNSILLGLRWDDACYVLLARSLLESDQFGLIHVPGATPAPPNFPFGYPFLLVPYILLFPETPDVMKSLSLVATQFNAGLLFWGWRWFTERSTWWGLAVTALYLFSPQTVESSRMVMSEAAFTSFLLAAMLLVGQAVRGQRRWWWGLLMGVVLTLVAFTRTIGLVVTAVVLLYLGLARGRALWRDLVLVLVTMLALVSLVLALTPVQVSGLFPVRYLQQQEVTAAVAPSMAATPARPSQEALSPPAEGDQGLPIAPTVAATPAQPEESASPTPEEDVQGGAARPGGEAGKAFVTVFKRGVRHLLFDLRATVLQIGWFPGAEMLRRAFDVPFVSILLGLGLLGLLCLGYYRWVAAEGWSVFNLVGICYFVVLLLWNWGDPRLLYPIQPQLYFSFLLGLEAVLLWGAARAGRSSSRRLVYPCLGGAVAAVVVFWAVGSALAVRDPRDPRVRTEWLKANSPATAIILTEEPIRDFFFSGRKTLAPPSSLTSADALGAFMDEYGVDYAVVGPRPRRDLGPEYHEATLRLLSWLEDLEAQGRVELVYESAQDAVKVFRVEAEGQGRWDRSSPLRASACCLPIEVEGQVGIVWQAPCLCAPMSPSACRAGDSVL
jgi:hypothetical protein